MLTGKPAREHGIVGNGWYFREPAEVSFWKQNAGLVQAETVDAALRRAHPGFTFAKLFWWFNQYSGADWSVTPRPHYPADGRKVFDVYTHPMEMRDDVVGELGAFPFPAFWGPASSIASSRWIAGCAKWVFEKHAPTLSLVYLPHLDYVLQKEGPRGPSVADELRAIDTVVGDLLEFYEARDVRVLVVSEYGITPVTRALHPNRILRLEGLVRVRTGLGRETLECGESDAFAASDHQIAHVYVKDPATVEKVAALFEGMPGVREVLRQDGIREARLDHPRSGEVILVAEPDTWFTYYYWLDDARAPDFARTVDIHRKPGYDPCELLLDAGIRFPRLRIGRKLLARRLGFRTLLDVIPLAPERILGSHGTPVEDPDGGPIAISRVAAARPEGDVAPIESVREMIVRHVEG